MLVVLHVRGDAEAICALLLDAVLVLGGVEQLLPVLEREHDNVPNVQNEEVLCIGFSLNLRKTQAAL